MWTYNQTPSSDELYHYGVLGMKWGKRKYYNKNGSLNDKGIKKYAIKGYAKDSYNGNKTKLGKVYDLYTGAHKIQSKIQYDLSSKKANEARAKKYLSDKKKAKNMPINKKLGKAIGKQINKKIEKNKKRDEQIKKTTDLFGVGGVALGSSVNLGRKLAAKKTMAYVLNSADNAYISSGKGSYNVNRGVDFIRRTAINGLNVSSFMDVARAGSDIQKAASYQESKKH